MSQDIIADALNEIMNAKRAKKKEVVVNMRSKLLINLLEIAKKAGYIYKYDVDRNKLKIEIADELNKCNAIKPRYTVNKSSIEKYMKRYLPARDIGIIIVSTPKGLMTHKEAMENKLGGCLIAYFY